MKVKVEMLGKRLRKSGNVLTFLTYFLTKIPDWLLPDCNMQNFHRRVTACPKLSKFTVTIAHHQSAISGFHFNFNRTSLGTAFSMTSQKLEC